MVWPLHVRVKCSSGPAGFQSRWTLGYCFSTEMEAAPSETTCVSGRHGPGPRSWWVLRRQPGQTARAVATSSCRGAQRPASIHLGEETGGPLNKLWRAQLPSLVKAFRGRTLASVPRGSPFHYGRLCVVEGAPIEPTELVEMPAPLPLPFESAASKFTPWARATSGSCAPVCGALGRPTAGVNQMRAMAACCATRFGTTPV